LLIEALSPTEIEIIRRSLKATVEGSFFPDREFHTLFGVDRAIVRTVYEAWSRQTVSDDEFVCAVKGSLNHLWGYPHDKADELAAYMPEGAGALQAILDRLLMNSRAERS